MKMQSSFYFLDTSMQLKKNPSFLNPFPYKPWFLRVCSASLLKTLREMEKLLVTSNFPISHSVFYPFGKLSTILIKFEIVICKLFHIGSVQNIVVWERVKYIFQSSL